MNFVFLTLEETYLHPLEAARELAERRAGVPLHVSAFTVGQLNNSMLRQAAERALAEAHFVFASMLFFDEHVRPVADLLVTAPTSIPIAAVNCAADLMKLTRMGSLKMDGEGLAGRLLNRSRPRKRATSENDKRQSGRIALGIVRSLPRLMRLVPGTAQDLRRYMMLMQYWTHGTPENLSSMLLLLAQAYGDRRARAATARLRVPEPVLMPQAAIFHPDARAPFSSIADYRRWRRAQGMASGADAVGTVGLFSLRSTILSGNTAHIDALIRAIERQGMEPVPTYAAGLDARSASRRFFGAAGEMAQPDVLFNLSGFALVGGMAHNESDLAAAELRRLDRPMLTGVPLNFQTLAAWRESRTGLNPVQIAMQMAIPELEGAIEPLVYGGVPEAGGRRYEPEVDNVARSVQRLAGWSRLARSKVAQRRVAIVLFNFPPNGGAVGSAAYLAVFPSLWRIMRELKSQGYTLDVPDSVEELRRQLVEGNRLEFGTPANVASAMSTAEYRRHAPWHGEISRFWGQPPGAINSDGERLLILGREYGNVFIGVQPPFGFEGDPMKLLMAEGITPHHGFAAFYAWLRGVWGADALLHLGTHGALEFMPGKQAGLSSDCWPARLIGETPHLYVYSANNPSEGLIARRRGGATLLSYLSPPLEQAGLYRGLTELKSMLGTALTPAATDPDLLGAISMQAEKLNLTWLTPDSQLPTRADLDVLWSRLLELERRIIPTGLHEIGLPPVGSELAGLLGHVAGHSRADLGLPSLIGLIAESSGRDVAGDDVLVIAAEAIERLLSGGAAAGAGYLRSAASVPEAQALPLLGWLVGIGEKLAQEPEIPSIIAGLDARYIDPSPGADVVRNPASVPTGRNIHALDPYTLPTALARTTARRTIEELLRRYLAEDGHLPQAVALVLWGTDNLKTGGEGIAQALELIGAEPLTDSLGRTSDVRLIPLAELGRPRIDVVLTCSGIFRDLLPNQMTLLDSAVRLAADADESPDDNFIRANCLAAGDTGLTWEDATARVFSNAPGAYGANVNFQVETGAWEDEAQLAETFMARKSFAYGRNGEGIAARKLLESALKRVELTFQNVDSIETGLSDIDHYFEYLGGVTRSVEQLTGTRPDAYVLDVQGMGGRVRTLGEMVEIESRTKLLNPKWSEGMLRFGYEGVREIGVRVSNTLGWSATTESVPGWVYSDLTSFYVKDKELRERMADLNPLAYSGIVGRLLEAAGRGYWQPDPESAQLLREIYGEAEDLAERIA